MVDAVESASNLLSHGLEKYLEACFALESSSVSQDSLKRISQQVLFVASFEKKIRQAKVALSRVQNYSSRSVNINTLPDDILLCILHLVANSQSCHGSGMRMMQDKYFPQYPQLLTHVCTRWRGIMLDSPSLWAHLDLMVSPDKFSRRLLDRAEAHVDRAGSMLFDVCIVDSSPDAVGYISMTKLIDLMLLVAPKMRALTISTYQRFTDIHGSLLEICLAKAVPGLLTQLVLNYRDRDRSSSGIITASDDRQRHAYLGTDLEQERIDEITQSISVLRQNNLYLNWETEAYPGLTKAYHGLSELSLTSRDPFLHSPTEPQLPAILESSPGLRIIRLRNVFAGTLDAKSIGSILLDDLEVLHLDHSRYDAITATLRCISPGPKPLRLTIDFCANMNPPSLDFEQELVEFLARSNVTRLELRGLQNYNWAGNILPQLPDLETLALEGIACNDTMVPLESNVPRIHTLHIGASSVEVDVLQQSTKEYSIQALTLWRCLLLGGSDMDDQTIDVDDVDLGSAVEILDLYGPGPIEKIWREGYGGIE